MPFLYIYSPSDFVSGLPAESSTSAAGSVPYTLQLRPGATPTLVEITDEEAIFNELDTTQTLTQAINLDGTNYAAGTTVHSAYDLINSNNGHKVTSVHFGGDGQEQGAVHGLTSTVLLQEGQSYTFNTKRTSYQQNNLYADYVACFAQDTLIDTPSGSVPAGRLQVGDLVETLDHGAQPLRLVLSQTVQAAGDFAPVVFPVGCMDNRIEIKVSQQHRMLMSGARTELLFGDREVLVPAIFLAQQGVGRVRPGGMVRYVHLVFDTHEIVFSGGCPSESFLPGDQAFLPPAAQREMRRLFGDLGEAGFQTARRALRRYEASVFSRFAPPDEAFTEQQPSGYLG
ncbi:MAG: Hint domain-containing protein [Sulfitobacter sp.]